MNPSLSQGTTAVWYRLYRKDGEEVGEIIAHDDQKIIRDDRVSFEKKVYEGLAIYKLQVIAS